MNRRLRRTAIVGATAVWFIVVIPACAEETERTGVEVAATAGLTHYFLRRESGTGLAAPGLRLMVWTPSNLILRAGAAYSEIDIDRDEKVSVTVYDWSVGVLFQNHRVPGTFTFLSFVFGVWNDHPSQLLRATTFFGWELGNHQALTKEIGLSILLSVKKSIGAEVEPVGVDVTAGIGLLL